MTQARGAVSVCFFLNGAVMASWLPHIPDLKRRLEVSDGGLGLLLLATAAGAVVALPAAGWLIGRLGSRALTIAGAAGLSVALALPVLAPGVLLSAAALALLGACNATLDVAMNAQAVMVEDAYRRPLMSSFHALYSLGGLCGAGAAATAMVVGLSPGAHVTTVGLLSGCAAGLAARYLVHAPPTRSHAEPVFVLPPAALLGLGLLTFCALLAEGAMGDWSAVYLRDTLGSTPAMAATGFAVFSLAMAVGRFGGDHLAGRFGLAKLVRYSGELAAGGLAMALLVGRPAVALVGFGLAGLGIANLIPALFSAAGRITGLQTGPALAAVATTGYCGYLVGPPLIGLTADLAGLPAALGLVCAACGLIAAGAVMVPPPRATLTALKGIANEGIT